MTSRLGRRAIHLSRALYITRSTPLRSLHSCRPALAARITVPVDPTPSPVSPGAIEYEPLPRSLSPSTGLFLISIPIPPSNWPARLEMASGLLSKTTKLTKQKGISVNMVYDGQGSTTDFPLKEEEEVYPARLFFPDGKFFQFDRFKIGSLSSERFLKSLEYKPKGIDVSHRLEGEGDGLREILVCTHGSRDCRCSERGGDLVHALKREVEKRGLEGKVRIGEIAHVGGHKYAANAITLPSLDMFSNLSTEHAQPLIDHLTQPISSSPSSPSIPSASSSIYSSWRGRYGLTEAQQTEIWNSINPEKASSRRDKVDGAMEKKEVGLKFKTWEGEIRDVKAEIGESLLQVAKKYDLPSMEGTCGGNLECATCHCYLPKSPAAPVSPPSEDELDMLGYAVGYRDKESRLGCQIKVTKEMAKWVEEGGVIGLPRF